MISDKAVDFEKKNRFFVGLCPMSDVCLLFWVSIGYIWIRYVVLYPGMGVLNAEIGGQSRKNFEQQIILESTNGSQLVWYYKNGLKLDAYDQESYAE